MSKPTSYGKGHPKQSARAYVIKFNKALALIDPKASKLFAINLKKHHNITPTQYAELQDGRHTKTNSLFLDNAFLWSQTPEDYKYWSNIRHELRRGC